MLAYSLAKLEKKGFQSAVFHKAHLQAGVLDGTHHLSSFPPKEDASHLACPPNLTQFFVFRTPFLYITDED